jgi:hypothetical protein
MIPKQQKGTAHTIRKEDYMLTRTVLIFFGSAVVLFFYIVAREGATAGAVTGRVLLSVLDEATCIAFIPAALYVVFRLVRR